jgi:hypothetical protein
VGQTKCYFPVLAQGIPLDPDVVTNAIFCVGQDVPFALSALPAGVTATNFQWALPGTYVNDHTNAVLGGSLPNSSENYFPNPDLLTNPLVANCWWVLGGTNLEASLTCILTFTNGNPSQPYDADGLFNMYRPGVDYIVIGLCSLLLWVLIG